MVCTSSKASICMRYEGFYLLPLLFSPCMVRANLDGLKTVTRRRLGSGTYRNAREALAAGDDVIGWVREPWYATYRLGSRKTPYGYYELTKEQRLSGERAAYWYEADEQLKSDAGVRFAPPRRWVPGMHMPFSQHRLFMRVRRIAETRLGAMTEEDARKEGMAALLGRKEYGFSSSALEMFMILWKQMHGAWDPEETVYEIEYERPLQGPATSYIQLQQEIAA